MLVNKGNSVTLPTDGKINTKGIKWYFNDIRIAQINGDLKICTDDQCDDRFRDRLKLDHQTGSLNITNTRTTDSGDYQLLIGGSSSPKIFNVIVTDVSVNKDEVKSVMEGEHVTLNSGVTEHQLVRWYFSGTLIALIDGDPNTTCLYDGEGRRFRDRLKALYKTGSLIITNITSEHTGRYEAEIIKSEISGKNERLNRNKQCNSTKITKKSNNSDDTKETFYLTVRASSDEEEPQKAPRDQNIDTSSGLSPGEIAGIVVAVLLVVAAAVVGVIGVMINRSRSSRNDMKKNNQGLLNNV